MEIERNAFFSSALGSRRAIACALSCAAIVAIFGAAASADSDPGYQPGPWHFRSVSCVDSTVTMVLPRLGPDHGPYSASDFKQSGVQVEFATGLGVRPIFPHSHAEVVHYQDTAGNGVMTAEHPGDRVQVCFLGGPAPTTGCNPDTDNRGRNYRVFDYKQRKQYWGGNGEHDCGGA